MLQDSDINSFQVPFESVSHSYPRYRLFHSEKSIFTDIMFIKQNIEKWLIQGKRILIVRNRVSLAQETMLAILSVLPEHFKKSTILIHSRFKYHDIQSKFRTLENWRKDKCGFVIVSTQVCESSLDIDSDILFSDICPLPFWIQRLGRLNRPPESSSIGDLYLLEPISFHDSGTKDGRSKKSTPKELDPQKLCVPYTVEEILETKEILERIPNGERFSRKDLDVLLNDYQQKPSEPIAQPFLCNNLACQKDSLRVASFTREAVFETDIDNIVQFKRDHPDLTELDAIRNYSIPTLMSILAGIQSDQVSERRYLEIAFEEKKRPKRYPFLTLIPSKSELSYCSVLGQRSKRDDL